MKTIDFTQILAKYKGQWVALDDDEITVISSGETAKDAQKGAISKGKGNPILFKVPTEVISYIG